MKKLFIKKNLIAVLFAIAIVFTTIGCSMLFANRVSNLETYNTKGAYSLSYEPFVGGEENTLKELKAKVSTDGKYLLLISAFDDTILKEDGLYYIGYKYTFNGVDVDTTQLEGARTSTYYGAVALKVGESVVEYGAKDIYVNDSYDGYGLIVYEIEFETTYQEESALLENIRAFITEVAENENGGYDVVEEFESDAKLDYSAFRAQNGGFETGDLTGWELTRFEGSDADLGFVTRHPNFFDNIPYGRVGNFHFTGCEDFDLDLNQKAGNGVEHGRGTLTSSPFVVGGSGFITYLYGGAGNEQCYIQILDAETGDVLAIYRQQAQNAAVLIQYKADLSALKGRTVKFQIVDNAVNNWGCVSFDELNTFYAKESLIPENAILAENILADKSALEAELALEIAEQGDYTADSFNAYVEKLNVAKAVFNNPVALQDQVNSATTELTNARLALTVRPIQEVGGAVKSFKLVSGNVKEINLSDYVNVNGLSSITYEVASNSEFVEVSEVDGTVYNLTIKDLTETINAVVSIKVLYKGEVKLTVEIALELSRDLSPTLKAESIAVSYDIYDLANKENITIDFAENVENLGGLELTYTATLNGEAIEVVGTTYTLTFEGYDEVATDEAFEITVSFVANGKAGSITYTYTLTIKDTSAFRIQNGGFETGDLTGWELTRFEGSDADLGFVTRHPNFFDNIPYGRVGNFHFTGCEDFDLDLNQKAGNGVEHGRGTLTSSAFVVGGVNYITFLYGGGGNEQCYIQILDAETGDVLAIYRQQAQNAAVLIQYKADLTEFAGKSVKFQIVDNAVNNWGCVTFDELNTYFVEESLIPENAILANNILSDKSALEAELALEIAEQGDYTLDSFNAYVEKLNVAKDVFNNPVALQDQVNNATTELTNARLALTVRPIQEVDGAQKSFKLVSGNVKEINLSDYVNVNGLSSITYEVASNSEFAELSELDGTLFSITAKDVTEAINAVITINVLYKGEIKLTVEIAIEITTDLSPVVINETVEVSYDIYNLENKDNITIDFAGNVDNPGELALTFSATYKGESVEVLGSIYTFAFGEYNDKATEEILEVTVSFVANGENSSITYTYILKMTDSTEYRLANGGFENGLEGWVKVGTIGDVSSDSHYWTNENGGYAFGMDGEKMFSAYAPNSYEQSVGTLTSSTFKVGGSNFVTFKIGALRDGNYTYVDVVDAESKQILARYYNGLWAENTDGIKSGCTLISYKADLTAFSGKEVFFRISDNADSYYGLFFADSFVTYYEAEPDGFNVATPVDYAVSGSIYDVFNGSFEMGGGQGWLSVGEIGVVTNAHGYWGDNIAYEKVGDYLFTGVESFGADTMREPNKGTLTSSTFEIGGSGYISFKLGGGGNEQCYVQVIDASTNEVLARYRQQAQRDAVLIQYVADLSAHIGKTVRFQIVDYATGGWGCVSFDNLVTCYASTDALPQGETANNIFHGNYTVTNGSFETGNLDGWTMNITEAGDKKTLGWVQDSEIDAGWYTKNDDRKDGKCLFTFVQKDGTNCENTKGTLNSSVFTLKQGTFIAFRFGGAGTRDVHVQLCNAVGDVIATFYNEAPGKVNTEMYAYYYQYFGTTTDCFIRVVDNSTGNYGCFVVDDFRANLESAPEGFIEAIR